MSAIKDECERLAKLAWPWTGPVAEDCGDPMEVYIGDDECKVYHPFEEDSEGVRLQYPDRERGAQAMLAALRVLANEPTPLIARLEALVASYRAAVADYGRDDLLSAFMLKVADELEAVLKGGTK